MKYAFIKNNTAVEVIESDPFMIFVHHYAEQFTTVDDSCKAGYVLNNGVWESPPTCNYHPTRNHHATSPTSASGTQLVG